MQNPSPQSYSYGGSNSTSSLLRKPQNAFPLPIPTIPEESDAKEKQSFDGNLPNSKTARNKNTTRHSTLVPGGLSDRSHTDNRSVMIQNNAGFSILKSSNPANASLIDSINAKKLRRFGTFAEGNQNSLANTSTSTFAHSPSSNTNSNVKFLEKSDWCMDNQCFLCTRTFSKMNGVFEHHCRVCGNAVCGECSSKKINDSRVCESCFYKSTHARAEERRKDQLKSKNATMKTYKKQLMREKEDLTQLIQKRYDLDKKVKEDKEEQNKTIESLQKEKEKAAEVLTKKTDTNVMLKKSLDVDKNFLKEKEVEYEELRNKINSLNLQVMQRKNNYESKKEELQRLFRQKMKYEESPSFVGLMNSLPDNDMASFQDANASTLSVGLTQRLNFNRGSSKYSTKG